MKTALLTVCLWALFNAAPSVAASARDSLLLGTWAVDIERLPIPAEMRPKSVTITFTAAENDAITTSVIVVDSSNHRIHALSTAPLDGTPTAVSGHLEADDAALTMPAPEVLVMQLAKGGAPASTRVYVLGTDGNSMIETAAYVGADRRPLMRTNYFQRVSKP